ncbi:MAG: ABC transporter ATP-binding protein [Gemmobacter sp.]|nr:ABC transporter ATP-binding protein [Gemmobacter sp.]
MLEIDRLEVRYSGIEALRGVSMTVNSGEVVAMIGPNGAGKSTLLNAISGIVPAHAGHIRLDGRELTVLPAWTVSAMGVLHVPEGRQVFADLTVLENLQLGETCLKSRPRRTTLTDVYDLFPILRERQAQLAGSLSGGQQQMLAIGRALMGSPEILLLDEPSLGLAPVIIAQVFDALRALRASGLTILLIEQNAHLALQASDRAYIIDQGRIVHSGASADLAQDDSVIAHYLGDLAGA